MAYFQRVKFLFGLGDAGDDSTQPYSVIAAASTNANLVKIGPGVVTAIHAVNVTAAAKFLKFYDLRTVPVAGSGTPVRRYGVPGATAGAGFTWQPSIPLKFSNGIGFTLTGGSADTDTTALSAGDVILTLEYI